jgi:hypothetical protein
MSIGLNVSQTIAHVPGSRPEYFACRSEIPAMSGLSAAV